jgi:multiple sugar transport system ATP-binding protein
VERTALSGAQEKGDTHVVVGCRPEHFEVVNGNGGSSLAKADENEAAGLAVTVNVVEELGADAYVYGTAEVGGETKDLVIRVGGRDIPEKGAKLSVVPQSGETHVFSTSTGERLSD